MSKPNKKYTTISWFRRKNERFIPDDLDHILKIMQTNLGLVYMYELSKEGIISYCNDDRTFYDQLIKVIGRKNKYGIK